jgi:hypothetical protein
MLLGVLDLEILKPADAQGPAAARLYEVLIGRASEKR